MYDMSFNHTRLLPDVLFFQAMNLMFYFFQAVYLMFWFSMMWTWCFDFPGCEPDVLIFQAIYLMFYFFPGCVPGFYFSSQCLWCFNFSRLCTWCFIYFSFGLCTWCFVFAGCVPDEVMVLLYCYAAWIKHTAHRCYDILLIVIYIYISISDE